ncbi:MAG: hypothetical protein GWO15_01780 [Nitrosopumilaceae archaeon]|nr:hypothetical protein [Nitrosopumilaceae archaeon]
MDKECAKWLKRSNVIFIRVLNPLGRPVSGGFKDKAPKMSKEREKTLFSQLRLDSTMRKEFNEYLGELDYTIAKRKKMTVISVPITDYLVVVAVKNEENAKKLAEKLIIKFGKIFA